MALLPTWASWLLPVLFVFYFVQRYMRHLRLEQMNAKYGYKNRRSLANMTDDEAWAIIQVISELEFPKLFEVGLQFALFRVCVFF